MVMLPMLEIILNPVFAVMQRISRSSPISVAVKLPPVPDVVAREPNLILCEAFWAILKRPAPCPVTLNLSPTAAVVGKVPIIKEPLFAI